MKKTAMAARKTALDHLGLLDEHVFQGHVRMEPALARLDLLDLVDDVLAFHDLAEDAVPPTVRARCGVVEEAVVGDIDEELARSGVWIGCPRHGDRVAVVLQAVAGLVLY